MFIVLDYDIRSDRNRFDSAFVGAANYSKKAIFTPSSTFNRVYKIKMLVYLF